MPGNSGATRPLAVRRGPAGFSVSSSSARMQPMDHTSMAAESAFKAFKVAIVVRACTRS